MVNMATRSFKSTSGSVSVALVALLVAAMVAETSAQLVSFIVVNELDAPLTVTLPATALGPSQTVAVPARSDRTVQLSAQVTLLGSGIYYEVRNCVYASGGSVQGRATSNTGTLRLYVTGHCGTGVQGLQFVASMEGDVCVNMGCAGPVDPTCVGPIS